MIIFPSDGRSIDSHLETIARAAVSPPDAAAGARCGHHVARQARPGNSDAGGGGGLAECTPQKLLDAAAAFEMIHSSSLILDDLPSMDDAAMRRGPPTLHRRFGEDLAILSAVALLNQSYGLLAAESRGD